MVRHSEGTDEAPNPYAVTYGYQFTITDFSDHPAVLGTWKGESLDSLGLAYLGKVSTAAGAYQIIKDHVKAAGFLTRKPRCGGNGTDSRKGRA